MLITNYGNWALITGASSGIGEEFARRLAEEGMSLILVARRKERLEKLSAELKQKNNIEIVIAPLDLSEDNFMEKLKQYVGNRIVSILVNNAGVGSTGEFINTNSEHEMKMVKLNCVAPTILAHHFVRPMVEQKRGAIIFLGSVVGYQPTPYMATYSASKVFNVFMGEALWWELKKYNIDVLAVNPGGTETEFQRIAKASVGPAPRKASDVVNTALKALGKKPGVVDGYLNKILAVSSKFASRKLTVIVSGFVTKKLYQA